jgi:predicted PhzF superfamily epimerase YddE/YHI9
LGQKGPPPQHKIKVLIMNNFALISAFSDAENKCAGNPAAVVLLSEQTSTEQLQNWAAELNQPATTFLSYRNQSEFDVRWFAPDGEIDLCGHGSLAAAHFLHQSLAIEKAKLFYQGGSIEVGLASNRHFIWLEPIEVIDHHAAPPVLEEALGLPVLDYFGTANKDIVLVESEAALRQMKPDFQKLAQLEPFGYAVTAPGENVDFVSRTLVPKVGALEDHATGSSHAVLTPFWSERLGKDCMKALQISRRGGYFQCEMHMNKVLLSGECQTQVLGSFFGVGETSKGK